MLKICENCGIEFKTPRSTIKYCNKDCYHSFPKSNTTRKRMSKSGKGKPKPIGFGDKISKAVSGKPKPWMQGENNPNYGGKIINKPDVKNKYLAAVKKRGLPWSEDNKKAHSIKMLGDSNWMRGRKHSKETIEKITNTKIEQLKQGLVKFGGHKISKPERDIANELNSIGIEFKSQFHINGLPYTYDFHILNTNIIIEFQGDYWHANPIKYKSGQFIKIQRVGKKLVDDIWARDLLKKESANKFGYNVIQIWQNDYKNFGFQYIIDKLKENGYK